MQFFRIFLKAFGLDRLLPVPFKPMNANEVHELVTNRQALLVDIRETSEWLKTGLPRGSEAVSLSDRAFEAKILDLAQKDHGKAVILSCYAGNRSTDAAFRLRAAGFKDLATLEGGILAWQGAGLPVTEIAGMAETA